MTPEELERAKTVRRIIHEGFKEILLHERFTESDVYAIHLAMMEIAGALLRQAPPAAHQQLVHMMGITAYGEDQRRLILDAAGQSRAPREPHGPVTRGRRAR